MPAAPSSPGPFISPLGLPWPFPSPEHQTGFSFAPPPTPPPGPLAVQTPPSSQTATSETTASKICRLFVPSLLFVSFFWKYQTIYFIWGSVQSPAYQPSAPGPLLRGHKSSDAQRRAEPFTKGSPGSPASPLVWGAPQQVFDLALQEIFLVWCGVYYCNSCES